MTAASVTLRPSGDRATITPDPLIAGSFVLFIGGTPQSHVALDDPGSLFYDYVRRIGNVIDRIRSPGEPITAVHLGAGALTLPRYVQVTRPDSEQHVVELENDLVGFVTENLPLPGGMSLAVHPGDAAERVTDLAPFLGGQADLVVSDLYRGTDTPAHLRTTRFFEHLARLLAPDGIVAINVADDEGLPALRSQLDALAPVFEHTLVLGPASVVTDARSGNAVVVASTSPALLGWAGALRAAGPHPGTVLSSAEGPLRFRDRPTSTESPTTPERGED